MSTTTEEVKVKPADTTHPCYCGCGEQVPSKSFYRPGHDARHAGQIGREVANGGSDTLFDNLPSESLVAKARGIADTHRAKIDAKHEREAIKSAKQAEKEAKQNAPEFVDGTLTVGKTERVGRRYENGSVEYMDGEGNWKPASKTAASTFEE